MVNQFKALKARIDYLRMAYWAGFSKYPIQKAFAKYCIDHWDGTKFNIKIGSSTDEESC